MVGLVSSFYMKYVEGLGTMHHFPKEKSNPKMIFIISTQNIFMLGFSSPTKPFRGVPSLHPPPARGGTSMFFLANF